MFFLFLGLMGATSLSLALSPKEFLGQWHIARVETGEHVLEGLPKGAYLSFKRGEYAGFVGCNYFFGHY